VAGPAERDGQCGADPACSDHTDVKPGGMLMRKSHLGGCMTLSEWTLVIIGT
jgi:hypothetical protein